MKFKILKKSFWRCWKNNKHSKNRINWYVFIFLVFNSIFQGCSLLSTWLELFCCLFILNVHHFFTNFLLYCFNRVLSSIFLIFKNFLMCLIYYGFKLNYHGFFLFTSQCWVLQFFIWPVFQGHHQSYLQLKFIDWW